MGDDITIGVTEIVNNIEVTAQPNDQVIDINVTDNSDEVTLNVTPNVIEVNINKGSSYARWGSIFGNLTDQADLTNALFNKADLVDGKVPSYQLPSFVDDVIEVANYAALPTVGEIGKIYITLDDNKIYRWSGSIYIEIASNQAIWGAITGSLTNQTDLVNALNLKADKSTTLTINGTTFDLSANRTYTIPTHDAVTLGTANGLSLSGQVLSLGLAGASSNGALSSTDWNTFNNKLSSLNGAVLTTTDQTIAGTKTFTNLSKFTNNTGSFAVEIDTTSSDALVVKNNGTTTLQISRSGEILGTKYRVSGGFASQFLKANGDLDSTAYTPASRTITINGVTQDLTANRSFTVATHDAVTIGTANGLSLSGQALSLALASGSTTGALSAADWTTFNNKQNTITNPITGSGTINFLPKFTQSGSIGNSQIFDNGTNVAIGTSGSTGYKFFVYDSSTGLGTISIQNTNASNTGNAFHIDYRGLGKIMSCGNGNELFSVSRTGGGYFASNVGIGTTSPSQNLHVVGNGLVEGVILYRNGATNILNIGGDQNMYGGTNSDGGIFVYGNNKLHLSTNSARRLTVDGSGNVGIATTSPTAKLDVHSVIRATNTSSASFQSAALELFTYNGSSVSAGTYLFSTNSNFNYGTILSNQTNLYGLRDGGIRIATGIAPIVFSNGNADIDFATERMRITSGGSVVVNNLGTGILYSNGGALTSTNPSDARLKDDITDLEYGLNEILKLRPVSYNWKNDTINQGKQFGFIAQEVQEVMPELISEFTTTEDEEEVVRLGLDKEGIYATLVNAIKELKAEIELLKQK